MTQTAAEPLTTPFEYDRQLVISVNVSNFDKAVDWYRDALGFELVYKLDQYGWGEMRTPWGGVFIGLGQSEELKHGGTVPTFGVKDIAAARSHLESLGTKFDGETHEIEGMVKLATFYDPDGNAWMLAESLNRDERQLELERYTFVLLRRPPEAPEYPQERLEQIQEQHLAHLADLHERGLLLLAGPFDDQPDESWRGLCIFGSSLDETRDAMASDPAVRAGRLEPHVMSWWTARGSLPASAS